MAVTVAAATFQVLRTSRQHRLRHALSPAGAGFVRYAYAAPLSVAVSVAAFVIAGRPLPLTSARFWVDVSVAGVLQILATVALLRAFRLRDFAVGTVYSKSEVAFVALASAVVLGEPLRPSGWLGIAVCGLGVAWLASRGSLLTILERSWDPAALLGLAAGAMFAGAAVGIRAASTSLGDGPALDRALLTLTAMLTLQALANTLYFLVARRSELIAVAQAWRPALPIGILSFLGSTGWAWAMTLESAAKVRTLGQVELVIAFALSRWSLRERHRWTDYAASALVLAGVATVAILG